jgi:hypothetical protein
MLRKKVLRIRYLQQKYDGVHIIVIEVVVPQLEISHFTITVDIAAMMLQASY